MKVVITPRKPDEVGGYLMMPLVANVPKVARLENG